MLYFHLKLNILEESRSALIDYLEKITDKISKLMTLQMAQDKEFCNRIREQVHVERLGFECVRNEGSHKRTSRALTYTDGRERVYELIREEIPAYVHLISVKATDYVGNHFKAVLLLLIRYYWSRQTDGYLVHYWEVGIFILIKI